MVDTLFNDTSILKRALGIDFIFVRGKEYLFDKRSTEAADLVFQDKWDAYCPIPGTILYVVEVKSGRADHEVVGQLKKAVDILGKRGKIIGHWDKVMGIGIAPDWTESGLRVLKDVGYMAFRWLTFNGKIVLMKA